MRALFDVNVLIALFDPAHIHHEQAHTWLANNLEAGWATCPITQNGCIRVLSQPKYPNAITVSEATRRLRQAISQANHEFWHDDLSIVESSHFRDDHIQSPRQLTDLYLLGLAVQHNGRLITFDRSINTAPVVGVGVQHLVVL